MILATKIFQIMAGVTWVGILYYFNFVQTEYFKEADASAKSDAVQKLVPRNNRGQNNRGQSKIKS